MTTTTERPYLMFNDRGHAVCAVYKSGRSANGKVALQLKPNRYILMFSLPSLLNLIVFTKNIYSTPLLESVTIQLLNFVDIHTYRLSHLPASCLPQLTLRVSITHNFINTLPNI